MVVGFRVIMGFRALAHVPGEGLPLKGLYRNFKDYIGIQKPLYRGVWGIGVYRGWK